MALRPGRYSAYALCSRIDAPMGVKGWVIIFWRGQAANRYQNRLRQTRPPEAIQ